MLKLLEVIKLVEVMVVEIIEAGGTKIIRKTNNKVIDNKEILMVD